MNVPLWINLKNIKLFFFGGFKLVELSVTNLSTSACKFVEWTEYFIGEALNTFKFGHIVNQIQLNCYLTEYTVGPSLHGIGLALRWLKPNPIFICRFVDCEDTCPKCRWLKLQRGSVRWSLSIVCTDFRQDLWIFKMRTWRNLSWSQGRFQSRTFWFQILCSFYCLFINIFWKDRAEHILSANLQLSMWCLFLMSSFWQKLFFPFFFWGVPFK